MATCQKSMPPISASTSLTRSYAPDGDAARGDHEVRHVGGLEQSRAQVLAAIGDDAEVDDRAAALLDRAAQREAVGVVDLPGLARRAGLGHLVARGEQGHARPRVHGDLAEPERRGEAQFLRPQDGSRLDDEASARHVLTAAAHVDPGGQRADPHAVARALDDLLRVDRAGSGRAAGRPS